MRKLALLFVIVVAAISATSATAGKVKYEPTLTVATTGTPWVIGGCGYNADYGLVTVEVFTPVGVGWVATHVGADGCLEPVSNFSSEGPGHYTVEAWQTIHNRDAVVAETSFDL